MASVTHDSSLKCSEPLNWKYGRALKDHISGNRYQSLSVPRFGQKRGMRLAEQQALQSGAGTVSRAKFLPGASLAASPRSVTDQIGIDPQHPPPLTFGGTGDVLPRNFIYCRLGNRKTNVTSNPSTGDTS